MGVKGKDLASFRTTYKSRQRLELYNSLSTKDSNKWGLLRGDASYAVRTHRTALAIIWSGDCSDAAC
jgi:hypothetical protein